MYWYFSDCNFYEENTYKNNKIKISTKVQIALLLKYTYICYKHLHMPLIRNSQTLTTPDNPLWTYLYKQYWYLHERHFFFQIANRRV